MAGYKFYNTISFISIYFYIVYLGRRLFWGLNVLRDRGELQHHRGLSAGLQHNEHIVEQSHSIELISKHKPYS